MPRKLAGAWRVAASSMLPAFVWLSAHARLPQCAQYQRSTRLLACRAIRAAREAAAELRRIGVNQPTVYIVSLYNLQVHWGHISTAQELLH